MSPGCMLLAATVVAQNTEQGLSLATSHLRTIRNFANPAAHVHSYTGYKWPLYLAGDHQWYLGLDVDNALCKINGLI